MKQKLRVFKIGGKVIDQEELLIQFLTDLSKIEGNKLLVHGGGKIATSFSARMGIQAQMVNGRRITDKDTLDMVLMVYGGLINKQIVARLQSFGQNAVGLSGSDLNVVLAHQRPANPIDFGFVGDVDAVNSRALSMLLEHGALPVLAPLSHDGKGQMLNTNADTIAGAAAIGLSRDYDVELFFCFEKKGVLIDPSDEDSVIKSMSMSEFLSLKEKGIVSDGMLPKLENSFDCIGKGVKKVAICHFSAIGQAGTGDLPGTILYK